MRCKYCDAGNVPRECNGQYEHWLVIKILPATIKVVPCKALKVNEPKYNGPLLDVARAESAP